MATLKSDVATANSSGLLKDRVNKNIFSSGRLRFLTSTYTTTAAEVVNDVIQIGNLPVGSVVLPDLCRVSSDGIGGTSAIIAKIGDAVSDNRYSATGITVTTAVTSAVTPVAATLDPLFEVTEAAKTVTATLTTLTAAPTVGKKIRFRIAYLIP